MKLTRTLQEIPSFSDTASTPWEVPSWKRPASEAVPGQPPRRKMKKVEVVITSSKGKCRKNAQDGPSSSHSFRETAEQQVSARSEGSDKPEVGVDDRKKGSEMLTVSGL